MIPRSALSLACSCLAQTLGFVRPIVVGPASSSPLLAPKPRFFAYITGHKKTHRKNKTKRRAIERKRIKKLPKSLRPKNSKTGRQTRGFYETKTPSDYPLGPNYKPQVQTEPDVPPPLLSATASPHVYVSSSACEDAELDPSTLFHHVPTVEQFRRELFGINGSFRYFPPEVLKYQYPSHGLPEVAFLGRSNVGKSSLVNGIMGRKLALTSKQPGRTQQISYYGWVEDSIPARSLKESSTSAFIVDLPGYGFAKGPDKAVTSWQETTQDFLLTRHRESKTLKRVFLLQDSRLGLPQPIDMTVAEWMEEAEIPYTIVLTKADDPRLSIKHANLCALKYLELRSRIEEGCHMSPVVHITSAKKETGLGELLSSVISDYDSDDT